MSTVRRKWIVASVVIAVLILANVGTIVAWLRGIGLIRLAEHLRAEYVTGTTIAIIAALLIMLPGRAVWAICVPRCPVCDGLLLRRGTYCAECGSRV